MGSIGGASGDLERLPDEEEPPAPPENTDGFSQNKISSSSEVAISESESKSAEEKVATRCEALPDRDMLEPVEGFAWGVLAEWNEA